MSSNSNTIPRLLAERCSIPISCNLSATYCPKALSVLDFSFCGLILDAMSRATSIKSLATLRSFCFDGL
jgi:hypothetical protein